MSCGPVRPRRGTVARAAHFLRSTLENRGIIQTRGHSFKDRLDIIREQQELDAHPVSTMLAAKNLNFTQLEGYNTNHFLQTDAVACHVISSSEPVLRAVAAFPGGNSNVSFYGDRKVAENRGVTLRTSGVREMESPGESQAVEFDVALDSSKFCITDVVLDSSRAARHVMEDPQQGGRPHALVEGQHSLQATMIEQADGFVLAFSRRNLNGKSYRLELSLPKDTVLTTREGKDGIQYILERSSGEPLNMKARAEVPYPSLTRVPLRDLVTPGALQKLTEMDLTSTPRGRAMARALQHLQFLVYEEKALAGSWRFQTYFGRDTLLTTLMLLDILTPKAIESALRSVLDRVDPKTGQVCHEEDVGSWAERLHLQAGDAEKARAQEPIYDMKMVDDDFILPVLLSRYLIGKNVHAQNAHDFLRARTPSGLTRLEAAQRNAAFIRETTEKTEPGPEGLRPKLVRILKGLFVGDWRDSIAGLAGGVYPGSINIDLVSNALDALDTLRLAGYAFPAVSDRSRLNWMSAKKEYTVDVDTESLRRMVREHLELPENESFAPYLRGEEIEPDVTVGEFADGLKTPTRLEDGLTYLAVALDENRNAIPVMNSDFVLRMFLGEPTPSEISNFLKLIELPYPLGLMTKSGMVVANAALSSGKTFTDRTGIKTLLHKLLGRNGYHGAVPWAWPEQMAQLGLMRQIESKMNDATYDPLVDRMYAALQKLRRAQAEAGELATSELRAVGDNGEAVPYGDPSTLPPEARESGLSETEANAGQYWNVTILMVELAYRKFEKLWENRQEARAAQHSRQSEPTRRQVYDTVG